MAELGLAVTAATVAQFYDGLLDGYLLDTSDHALASAIAQPGLAVDVAPTVMTDLDARIALARRALAFAARLRGDTGPACSGF